MLLHVCTGISRDTDHRLDRLAPAEFHRRYHRRACLGVGSHLYQQLAQPSWAPPPAVFGPVWSLSYALMGIAAWLAWREGAWQRQRGCTNAL